MQVTRRQFFKVCAGGLGSSSLAMLGFRWPMYRGKAVKGDSVESG